ncbi:MAG: diacylglycerol kinase family lipid kinase [Nitrospirae bacterium]|nr:diacylglycerol kinase family lipid kinase [Nitrospirota bacterium]
MSAPELNIFLIANPISGGGALRAIEKAESLIKKKGFNVSLRLTLKKGDAERFVREISNLKSQISNLRIVIASGDGTINEVINGLLSSPNGRDIPIALIPSGVTNVLAKELSIPEDVEKAVEMALTGAPKKVSLGMINNRYFATMAGIGFDGEAVFMLNERIKKISGKGSHIIAGLNCLRKYNPPLIEVKTPKGVFTGYTAIIGKAACYGGYFKVTPMASLTDPSLDLCLFKGRTRRDLLRFVIGVIRKKHLSFLDLFYGKFPWLEITSRGAVHVQIDGDYFGTLPVKMEVAKDALSIIW